MVRAHKVVPTSAGEAVGALIPSPRSPRGAFRAAAAATSRRLRRVGMRPRHGPIGLETVLEEDPSLGSEVEDDCFVPSSGIWYYLTCMAQLKKMIEAPEIPNFARLLYSLRTL